MPASPAAASPVVFISYSHDSDAHRERVLGLSERLRDDGYETRLDRYVNGSPLNGWPRWMMDGLDAATHVLVNCTETYYRRFRGHEAPHVGKGVDWEGALITNEIYQAKSKTVKFVPVLFESADQGFIPEPLQTATQYLLNSESRYGELKDFLDGVAGIEPRPVGERKRRKRQQGTPLTFAEAGRVATSSHESGGPARAESDGDGSQRDDRDSSASAGPPQTGSLVPPYAAQRLAIPHNLPFASIADLFKGRDGVLALLDERFKAEPGKAAAVVTLAGRQAIHGLGGVGKTRLAVEYAWRRAEEYSAVLFVTADSESTLQTQLAGLVRVLKLPEADVTEQPVQVEAVLNWLEQRAGWLLILDNVDTEDAARAVEELLPRLHSGRVLITSRLSSWSGAVQAIPLDVLDVESAKEFLLARTGAPRDAESLSAAQDLAEELGRLALALEQAAAYVKKMRLSLSEYLQRWRAHEAAVQEWYDGRLMKYPRSLAKTWQITLEKLATEAVELLNVMAWFAPEESRT